MTREPLLGAGAGHRSGSRCGAGAGCWKQASPRRWRRPSPATRASTSTRCCSSSTSGARTTSRSASWPRSPATWHRDQREPRGLRGGPAARGRRVVVGAGSQGPAASRRSPACTTCCCGPRGTRSPARVTSCPGRGHASSRTSPSRRPTTPSWPCCASSGRSRGGAASPRGPTSSGSCMPASQYDVRRGGTARCRCRTPGPSSTPHRPRTRSRRRPRSPAPSSRRSRTS